MSVVPRSARPATGERGRFPSQPA